MHRIQLNLGSDRSSRRLGPSDFLGELAQVHNESVQRQLARLQLQAASTRAHIKRMHGCVRVYMYTRVTP